MNGTIKLDSDQVETIVREYAERNIFKGEIRVKRINSPSYHSLGVEVHFTDEPEPEPEELPEVGE